MAITIGDALLKLGADSRDLDAAMVKVSGNIKQGTEKWKNQIRAVGVAFTAVGVAGLKLVGDARKMNAALSQSAITLGVTTGEMRELALETTDVTFKLDTVISTFDLLSRAGIRSTAEMKATAMAFDVLGDATGYAADVVADKLIPAFKVFGIDLPKSAEELDKFTWLTKNTMVTLEEFAAAMDYVAAYGSSLDLTIGEMIASMAALEEKGITGSAVTRVFRTAITRAASGAMTMNEALEITQESVDKYQASMGEATGITQQYADAANEQYGIMDKIKQMWDEWRLRLGSLMLPLEAVFGVLVALGPALLFLSTSAGRAAVSFVALRAAMLGIVGAAAGAAYGGYRLGEWIGRLISPPAEGIEATDKAKESTMAWANELGFLGGTINEASEFIIQHMNATEEATEAIDDLTEAEQAQVEATKEAAERTRILAEAQEEMARTAREAYQEALGRRATAIIAEAGDVMRRYAQYILDSGKAATIAASQLGRYVIAIARAQAIQTLTNQALQNYIESVMEFGVDSEEATETLLDYVDAFAVGAEMAAKMEEALKSLAPWLGVTEGAGVGGAVGGPSWFLGGYQHGGIVPGDIGVPRLAVVHGGERITPPGDTYDSHSQITVNATIREEGDIYKLARELHDLERQEVRSRGQAWS